MTNSHQWIDALIPKLFEAEDRYLGGMISELNRQNSEVKKQRFNGFIYMGVKFVPPELRWNLRWIAKQPLPTLDFSLLGSSSEFIVHFNRVDLDKRKIKQALFLLLNQCNTLQEIRDVLPDCLVSLVPEIANMDRFIQDPLYMMRSDKFFMDQFPRILEKIEFYVMSHMIY